MPFSHNDHYHRLLLRELPSPCHKALDVGCGTGNFARKVALRGIEVDAVDADGDVVARARELTPPGTTGRIRFQQADIARTTLPPETYDYISCLASLHHVPFDTVRKLRDALAPGGVLVVLGCYRETPRDLPWSLAAVPANAVCRAVVLCREKLPGSRARGQLPGPSAPTTAPAMSLAEIREHAAEHLPQFRLRRLLFWRYLLVHREGQREGAQ